MLDSFLSDFSLIKNTFDTEGDHNLFGKKFSFFSAEPIIFYNSETDVIVYANSMFSDEFNFTVEDLAEWKYSMYPLLNKEDQEPFKKAIDALLTWDESNPFPDATYRLVNKTKKYSYYRLKIRKLHKSYYYIQLENSVKLSIPVLKNKTAHELMNNAEEILKFGFWKWDVKPNKIYWTKGMYHLLEYDDDNDIDDISLSLDFYYEHIVKTKYFLEFEKRFLSGEIKSSYMQKFQLKTKKGNLLTVYEHGHIELDEEGNMVRALVITRDITEQEESIKTLADYKAMMEENETFLNYGSWESDPLGDVIYWSDGMYHIFGYDDQEKNNTQVNLQLYERHIAPDNLKTMRENNSLLPKNYDFYQHDYEIKDNKDNVKILSTYAKVIRNAEQEITKIIGTTRDVTELKIYERSLENKINELNKSNHELEEFAYVASHDLQEPLRKISTFGQRLQFKLGSKLGDDGNMYVNRMMVATDNMRKLIDNLLELSRISQNQQPTEQVDLSFILKQVLEELDLKIDETNTVITIEKLPVIEAIASQMQQLFANLLNNCIKFRKTDVPLKIDITFKTITAGEKKDLNLSPAENFYSVRVKDNGVGFEQEYAEKIFQIFQRLQGKSEYPGTGIGLSICKKIVLNHKGLIYAKSELGKGATFFIILPKTQ